MVDLEAVRAERARTVEAVERVHAKIARARLQVVHVHFERLVIELAACGAPAVAPHGRVALRVAGERLQRVEQELVVVGGRVEVARKTALERATRRELLRRDEGLEHRADRDVDVVVAHVLAQAVLELRPGSTLGFGPPIDDGFYYDFILSEPLTEDDFPALEKKMKHIIKLGQKFEREELPKSG